MKAISAFILLLCASILVAVAIYNHHELPPNIASHFDGSGAANGWTSKSSFTFSMLTVGIGIPALVSGVIYCIRFFPARFLNVPNPAFWRDPANFRKACDFLFVSSMWFGSAFLLWQAFFSQMIVEANRITPPHFDSAKAVMLTVLLLIFTLGWVVALIARFLKTDPSQTSASTQP